jgi:hypothetical protein
MRLKFSLYSIPNLEANAVPARVSSIGFKEIVGIHP